TTQLPPGPSTVGSDAWAPIPPAARQWYAALTPTHPAGAKAAAPPRRPFQTATPAAVSHSTSTAGKTIPEFPVMEPIFTWRTITTTALTDSTSTTDRDSSPVVTTVLSMPAAPPQTPGRRRRALGEISGGTARREFSHPESTPTRCPAISTTRRPA